MTRLAENETGKPSPPDKSSEPWREYEERLESIVSQWPDESTMPVGLAKRTSNLFRKRRQGRIHRVDMRDLRHLIAIHPTTLEADVEGLITYEESAAALLPHGYMPAVVPELKTITVGGAIAGGGIESTSHRFGFVHESVTEMDILTATGNVVTARADNEHADLFTGFPCTYGTLGYVLRARIRILPVKPYVALQHREYAGTHAFFTGLGDFCARAGKSGAPEFIEGVVFDRNKLIVTTGTMVSSPPQSVSNYKGKHIYYRSLLRHEKDCLSIEDYLWRWDTDWFWCARAFGVENPLIRTPLRALGLLHSGFYGRLRRRLEAFGILGLLQKRKPMEWVIQDVEIPLRNAPAFLDFYLDTIGILPCWVCPAQSPPGSPLFPIYATEPETLYLNFGFWGGVPQAKDPSLYNRRIEEKVTELGGKKSLYSDSFYDRDTFDKLYNAPVYTELKRKYDPHGRFPEMYTKCVTGA